MVLEVGRVYLELLVFELEFHPFNVAPGLNL